MSGNNTVKYSKVLEIGLQSELIKGESATGWTAGTDVTALTTSTTHKTGATSVSYAKSGTTGTTGIISRTFEGKNMSLFALHKLKWFINLSSLTNVASVSLTIGIDASNNNVYTTADTSLSTGWNELDHNCDSPTTINGNGIDWYNITYAAVTVTFDAAANTLTDILVDSAFFYKLDNAGGSTPGENVNISQVGGSAIALGETTESASLPVTIATDRSPFDAATNSDQVSIINFPQPVAEVIADETNETSGTTTNRYIPLGAEGYNRMTIQFEKTGGTDSITLTADGGIDALGTAGSSVTYQTTTQYSWTACGTGTEAASYTADEFLALNPGVNFSYVNVKTVSAGGANDADYKITIIRWRE